MRNSNLLNIPENKCEIEAKCEWEKYLQEEKCKGSVETPFSPCDYDPVGVWFFHSRPYKSSRKNGKEKYEQGIRMEIPRTGNNS